MIDSGLEGAKIVQLARLTYEGQRLYPGLDGAFWHGVPDRGAILDGVFLATKPPRFVWRRHFTFRDVPPPG